jgi:hypothetical protein
LREHPQYAAHLRQAEGQQSPTTLARASGLL